VNCAPRIVAKLCADLGRLPSGNPASVPPPSPKPIDGMHVTIVQKKDIPAKADADQVTEAGRDVAGLHVAARVIGICLP